MNKLRHGTAALILFAMLLGLFMSFYDGMSLAYDIPDESYLYGGVPTNETIGEKLLALNIVENVDFIVDAFDPASIGNPLDLVGAIFLSGLGFIFVVLSIFTTPFEIAAIIEATYNLPPMFLRSLLILMCVYIAYIIVSAKLKKDL